MKLAPITEMLHNSGTTALVGNARFGYHTLPDGMVDDYTEYEQLVADNTDRWNNTDDPKVVKTAQALADKLATYTAWGNGGAVLVEHVQPALTRLLKDVAADRQAAGRHALAVAPTIDMLDEPDDVRAAIVRLTHLHPRYGALRASWTILRSRGNDSTDPLGLASPLAEVANLPDLFSDWEKAHHGRAPWPWNAAHLGVKLAWLIDNGGRIWLPTAAEQNEVWTRYNPQVKQRTAA